VSRCTSQRWRAILILLVVCLLSANRLQAQCGNPGCISCPPGAFCSIAQLPGTVSGTGCNGLTLCNQPVRDASRIQAIPTGSTWTIRAEVDLTVPGNSSSPGGFLCTANGLWFTSSPPPANINSPQGFCQSGNWDKFRVSLQLEQLTCANLSGNSALRTYSLSAVACLGAPFGCQKREDVPGIDLSPQAVADLLGCPKPPPSACNGDQECGLCLLAGQGAASPAGNGASADPPGSGPGARLRYQAGGAGGSGWPGAAAWNATLGRFWSHDYAERIVLDPDDRHVWLITRFASFREFTDANADGVYEKAAPSDEKRRLTRTATGWELRELDGTVHVFDASGLWQSTTDRHANAKAATYTAGVLTRVDFPDGRHEDFTYLGGKLRTITESGAGGAASRTWTYTWTGNDLTRIDRPDGTALDFFYSSDPNLSGYLTRMDLRGTTPGSGRVESAWEHDTQGNVVKLWRGDPSFTGPNAVDKWSLSYDNPARPARTEVTDALGKVSVYTIGRDTGSRKPRLERLEGECPACGTGPNSVRQFGDPLNPLLPTVIIDGRGLRTEFTYNANGQVTRKLEAPGTPLERDTVWQYHAAWPALVTRMDVPSTSGGAARRETLTAYDATGNPITRTIQGAESGGAFSHVTASTFNAGGQPLTIDPPGHGAADATTFTYDATRGNGKLIVQTRTDPLVGATSFTHDAYNRRTEVTDPNGVKTITTYDALNRVTQTVQQGDPGAGIGDLVTTYTFNEFGDLFRTMLPEGNLIEYGYDGAGRLVSIERKPDAVTPGERTLYTLDAAGHRTREDLQRWNGSAWATESWTEFVYSTRCHLEKVIRPGAVTEYDYDCNGNLARVWDPNHPSAGKTVSSNQAYTYDQLDRLLSVSQPWTGAGGGTAVTTYEYDVQDHLKKVTDAEGNATSYVYSDRDLMTSQVSPVSGTTTYAYNEHGELVTEIDARGVTVTRAVDVLDRVTTVSYPDPSLTVSHAYDAGAFGKGRLTGLTRHGETITYAYDRFGRLIQDGALSYAYDRNGNRTAIDHPEGVTATYTHDFADREATLSVQVGAAPVLTLVNAASYKPFGPLSSLTLGNGLTETRSFDGRYAPAEIRVDGTGTLLHWSYTTDAVGNISAIADVLSSSNNRTYGYQDIQYFLTQGNGPWGPRSWTYDRIGNRLTESRGTVTDTYVYPANPAGGHNSKLHSITFGTGDTHTFSYDPAGNTTQVYKTDEVLQLIYDGASRLSMLRSIPEDARTFFAYDGRSFLRRAEGDVDECHPGLTVPTYDSEGLLRRREHRKLFTPAAPPRDSETVLYFAGRPVALLRLAPSSSDLKYLTTDHLGTPILATADTGALVWQGGFEPFGADWNSAGAAGVFLRFPGQWVDGLWEGGRLSSELYYNVHRWYGWETGRYGRVDPINLGVLGNAGRPRELPLDAMEAYFLSMLRTGNPEHEQPYLYAVQNPLLYTDPSGLFGPGALATAGGACIAVDGPIPVGDIIGIPLLIGAAGWAMGEIVVDWWANAKDCEECERDKRDQYCYPLYLGDIAECKRRHPGSARSRQACYGSAASRYADCLSGKPSHPLYP
jgi:YD repeat-containing protein